MYDKMLQVRESSERQIILKHSPYSNYILYVMVEMYRYSEINCIALYKNFVPDHTRQKYIE